MNIRLANRAFKNSLLVKSLAVIFIVSLHFHPLPSLWAADPSQPSAQDADGTALPTEGVGREPSQGPGGETPVGDSTEGTDLDDNNWPDFVGTDDPLVEIALPADQILQDESSRRKQ